MIAESALVVLVGYTCIHAFGHNGELHRVVLSTVRAGGCSGRYTATMSPPQRQEVWR